MVSLLCVVLPLVVCVMCDCCLHSCVVVVCVRLFRFLLLLVCAEKGGNGTAKCVPHVCVTHVGQLSVMYYMCYV